MDKGFINGLLFFRYGLAGSSNTTGDDQKKLDVLSNELFINMLKHSFTTCLMVSEENENVIEVETEMKVASLFCFKSYTSWCRLTFLVIKNSLGHFNNGNSCLLEASQ